MKRNEETAGEGSVEREKQARRSTVARFSLIELTESSTATSYRSSVRAPNVVNPPCYCCYGGKIQVVGKTKDAGLVEEISVPATPYRKYLYTRP